MNLNSLPLLYVNAPDEVHSVPISKQADVEASLLNPLALLDDLKGLPGVSVMLNTSEKSALICVSRGYDLLAQVLIYFTFSTADAAFASDLLAYDPTVNDPIEELRTRAVVVAATEKLTIPFGLVAWKNIALDRLSQTEHLLLKVEMERIAGAMAYHQLVS